MSTCVKTLPALASLAFAMAASCLVSLHISAEVNGAGLDALRDFRKLEP